MGRRARPDRRLADSDPAMLVCAPGPKCVGGGRAGGGAGGPPGGGGGGGGPGARGQVASVSLEKEQAISFYSVKQVRVRERARLGPAGPDRTGPAGPARASRHAAGGLTSAFPAATRS